MNSLRGERMASPAPQTTARCVSVATPLILLFRVPRSSPFALVSPVAPDMVAPPFHDYAALYDTRYPLSEILCPKYYAGLRRKARARTGLVSDLSAES